MLVEIKKLLIEPRGYKRSISLQRMYINSSNIISISDYHGAENFLLQENSKFAKEEFCLIKLSEGEKFQEIIAHGSAKQIYESIGDGPTRRLLNG